MLIADEDLFTHAGLLQFQELCASFEACEDSADYRAAAIADGWSLNDLIQGAVTFDPENGRRWGAWCRVEMRGGFGPAIRYAFSEVATVESPRTAAQLCIDLDDLGVDETTMLLSRWHGDYRSDFQHLFPMIEAEWAAKIGDG